MNILLNASKCPGAVFGTTWMLKIVVMILITIAVMTAVASITQKEEGKNKWHILRHQTMKSNISPEA